MIGGPDAGYLPDYEIAGGVALMALAPFVGIALGIAIAGLRWTAHRVARLQAR